MFTLSLVSGSPRSVGLTWSFRRRNLHYFRNCSRRQQHQYVVSPSIQPVSTGFKHALDLMPFWDSQDGYWVSSETTTTQRLRYSYPEFNNIPSDPHLCILFIPSQAALPSTAPTAPIVAASEPQRTQVWAPQGFGQAVLHAINGSVATCIQHLRDSMRRPLLPSQNLHSNAHLPTRPVPSRS